MTMRLDRVLLRPVDHMSGGKGTVQYRWVVQPSVFTSPWAYVDHLAPPSGTSTSPRLHPEVAEFYYVMSGQGVVTVAAEGSGSEVAPIRAGNTIPIRVGMNGMEKLWSVSREKLEDCASDKTLQKDL